MKLHHTEYKKNYRNYILSTVHEDEEGKDFTNDNDKIEYIFNRFYDEYDYEIKKHGKFKAMSMWLEGGAINIEYTNLSIVQLACEMGSVEHDPKPSEKLQQKILNNYYDFMANIVLSFKRA